MLENRSKKCNNDFIWNQFLAELDVKVIKSGVAYNIFSWSTLQGFSGEAYYRLHLPITGKSVSDTLHSSSETGRDRTLHPRLDPFCIETASDDSDAWISAVGSAGKT